MDDVIISIHPRHASAILAKQKKIELRRRVLRLNVGARLWIYATKPVGAIIATARVEKVVRGEPDVIWSVSAETSNLSRAEFDAYFFGASEAVALFLTSVVSKKPIEMKRLRAMRPGFHPPQMAMRLTAGEVSFLNAANGA